MRRPQVRQIVEIKVVEAVNSNDTLRVVENDNVIGACKRLVSLAAIPAPLINLMLTQERIAHLPPLLSFLLKPKVVYPIMLPKSVDFVKEMGV
jgi:hypothetical protein